MQLKQWLCSSWSRGWETRGEVSCWLVDIRVTGGGEEAFRLPKGALKGCAAVWGPMEQPSSSLFYDACPRGEYRCLI